MITNEIYFFKNQSSVGTSDFLYNVNDGTLVLQVDGDASKLDITVFGNTDLRDDNFVTLKVINASDYSIADNITSTGIYWADLNGIRKCYVVINSITGECNVKGMTKSGLTTDLVARAMAAQGGGGGGSYTLPVATTSILGGIKASDYINVDSTGATKVMGFNDLNNDSMNKFWTGTKAEYDALTSYDENTFYAITDDKSSDVLVINLTENASGVYSADKTQAQIKNAYDNNKILIAHLNNSILPLMNGEVATNGDMGLTFGYTNLISGANIVSTRAIHYLYIVASSTEEWTDADIESEFATVDYVNDAINGAITQSLEASY